MMGTGGFLFPELVIPTFGEKKFRCDFYLSFHLSKFCYPFALVKMS